MADKTLQEQLELANQEIESLKDKNGALEETVGRQTEQINLLRKGIGLASRGDVPKEVIVDFNERVAAGVPESVAFEKAVAQHEHNQNLAKTKEKASTKK